MFYKRVAKDLSMGFAYFEIMIYYSNFVKANSQFTYKKT